MNVIHHKTTSGLTGDDALAEALTSNTPAMRIMARGAASLWASEFIKWASDELNRPKADPVDVLQVIAVLHVQFFASLAAQLLEPSGDQVIVGLYAEEVTNKMAKHIAGARQTMEEAS